MNRATLIITLALHAATAFAQNSNGTRIPAENYALPELARPPVLREKTQEEIKADNEKYWKDLTERQLDADQAAINYVLCIQRTIPQLDDGISGADAIAIGIASACRPNLQALQANMATLMEEKFAALRVESVLRFRASKRLSRAAPTKPPPRPSM